MESSTIRIQRTNQFVGCLRKSKVFVDGKLVGKLKNGEAAEYIVEPGRHIVYAKMDWCRSRKLTVDLHPGEYGTFICGSINGYVSFIMIMILGLLPAIIENFEPGAAAKYPLPAYIVLPAFLLVFSLLPSTFVNLKKAGTK